MSIDSTLDTITIVKSDTQEIIVDWKDVESFTNDTPLLLVKGDMDIEILDTDLVGNWDDPNNVDSEYKISITTGRGNFFNRSSI